MKTQSAWLTMLVAVGMVSVVAQAAAPIPSHPLSQDPEWIGLLHYQPRTLGSGWISQADSTEFFVSPDGATDPEGELRATILAFQAEGPKAATSLQCRFPARYDFLKRHGALSGVNAHAQSCPELEKFLSAAGGSALSLVFSSAYPGSPPSMFGHTFLRIHAGDRPALSDFAINYAASVGENENSIAFALLGVAGGYWGTFGIERYFMKVNEYANAESRDLWEYELDLTPAEVRRVLFAVWELRNGPTLKYYFFDENCSNEILHLILTAKGGDPQWTAGNPGHFAVHVVPAETVKVLTQIPGAIREVRFRPSLRTQLKARYRVAETSPEKFTERDRLDTKILAYQYETFRSAFKLSAAAQADYDRILLQRAALGPAPAESVASTAALFAPERPASPDQGHGPYALALRAGVAAENAFTEISARTAYHDLLNNDRGFPAWTQVEFPNATLRYTPAARRLMLEHLGLVSVISLTPWNSWEHRVSWQVDLGLSSPKDLLCRQCNVMGFEVGGGWTVGAGSDRVVISALATARGEAGSGLAAGSRFIPRATLSLLGNPGPRDRSPLKFQLSASRVWDVFQQVRQTHFDEGEVRVSWSLSANWDIRANSKWILPGASFTQLRQKNDIYRELALSVHRYF